MKTVWISLALLLSALANPVPYESDHHSDCPDMRGVLPESQSVKDLFTSFAEGFRSQPEKQSACFNSTMALVNDLVSLYNNVGELLTGNTSIVFTVLGSYGRLSNNFEDILEDCDFGELLDKLEKLISPMGAGVVFARYSSNSDKFSAALTSFGNCSDDLKLCGSLAGELLKLMLDWGL